MAIRAVKRVALHTMVFLGACVGGGLLHPIVEVPKQLVHLGHADLPERHKRLVGVEGRAVRWDLVQCRGHESPRGWGGS